MAVEELDGATGDTLFPFDIATAAPSTLRQIFRQGRYTGTTANMAIEYTQGNLAILPAKYALDFARFCQRNPKPCPLIGVSDTGDPMMRTLGEDIDIRTDIPQYNIYRDGELENSVSDIRDYWNEDSVAFVLGCSFSFEMPLMQAGIEMRHITNDAIVSMYRSSIETERAGPFGGGTVVSMRPMSMANAVRAVEITARYPHTHGTPVHIGDPKVIGIKNLDHPDWGEPTEFKKGEVPVFWACGVTPQNAIRDAGIELVATHTPGRMLITDLPASKVS